MVRSKDSTAARPVDQERSFGEVVVEQAAALRSGRVPARVRALPDSVGAAQPDELAHRSGHLGVLVRARFGHGWIVAIELRRDPTGPRSSGSRGASAQRVGRDDPRARADVQGVAVPVRFQAPTTTSSAARRSASDAAAKGAPVSEDLGEHACRDRREIVGSVSRASSGPSVIVTSMNPAWVRIPAVWSGRRARTGRGRSGPTVRTAERLRRREDRQRDTRVDLGALETDGRATASGFSAGRVGKRRGRVLEDITPTRENAASKSP